MKAFLTSLLLCSIFFAAIILGLNCSSPEKKEMSKQEMVAKGAYLVNTAGCNDCHSPKVFTRMGPVPDTTRLLSGHPSNSILPAVDTNMVTPGKWYLASSDLTAWVGPWGISFTANLTPDEPTGIGTWTEEIFIKALRTGKHMGFGRPILPPMPWDAFAKLTDQDLKSIFAYLRTLPPVRNQVPNPVPPNMLSSINMSSKKM